MTGLTSKKNRGIIRRGQSFRLKSEDVAVTQAGTCVFVIGEGGIAMRYLLALVLPPVAVIYCHRPRQLPVSLLLTACLWVPGAVHALILAHDAAARARTDRLADVVLAYEERMSRAYRQRRLRASA
jgi:uncharacterized membrane protein YqaE (UPF0057 family)